MTIATPFAAAEARLAAGIFTGMANAVLTLGSGAAAGVSMPAVFSQPVATAQCHAYLRAHVSQLDPAAGPATYLTASGFLESVEARALALGALAGVRHAEGYRVRGPLAVHDARSLLPSHGDGHA